MKIAIISNLYPPYARGGAEQVARRMAEELHLRGHQVFVISTRPFLRGERMGRRASRPQLTETGAVKVFRFAPFNLYYTLDDHKFPFPVRAVWHLIDLWSRYPGRQVLDLLKQEQPDLVITHNLVGMGLAVVQAIREAHLPHIHVLHDIQLSVPSGLMIAGKEQAWLNRCSLRRWYERQTQAALGSPPVVLAPSKFLVNFHRERGFFPRSRVEVLPNPAPPTRPLAGPKPAAETLNLIYAGQLEKHKGIIFLYDTLQQYQRPWQLHIAGEGTLADLVAGWAQRDSRLHYHGFVSFEHLVNLFQISDAAVVPSLCYEGSPAIIYEALQSGLPVLAPDIGGVGELMIDGKNGYLFRPGDAATLLQALHQLADNQDRFAEQAAAIAATVEPYRIDRYIDRLEEIMKGLVK